MDESYASARFETFAGLLLDWFEHSGRHDLPWQQDPTPYRVWVSEIMLQQTQVATVVPYFLAFMERFPDVGKLASADVDDVMARWSGLGYYSRARNLHRSAQLMMENFAGELPDDLDSLLSLPGIGRSTAGAILSLAFGQRAPILDGNVKRVLARFHAIESWTGESQTLKRMWALADAHTPEESVGAYTQAIMDLGATLCTRREPHCLLCPVMAGCEARLSGRVNSIPASRPRRERPKRTTCFALIRNAAGELFLERRPPVGIWGGLWCFPEIAEPSAIAEYCESQFGIAPTNLTEHATINHGFTHFQLDIKPIEATLPLGTPGAVRDADACWIKPDVAQTLGLPKPAQVLLATMG